MMTTSKTDMEPIPVDFVCQQALTLTEVKRKPLVGLIQAWGEETDCQEAARQAVSGLTEALQVIDTHCMPSFFYPRFRNPEVAAKLVDIVRDINTIITNKTEPWSWALVMKVMMDELIIMKTTPNKFDTAISQMIPQKAGTIRKNGDYTIIHTQDVWSLWSKNSHLDPQKAALRTKCNQIALKFAPLLERTILLDY